MDFLSLWQRLQLIAIYADGIFCSGAITATKQERVLLNRIINSNPDLFEVLYADKTKIYKMTFVFYTKFGLEAPKIVFRKPNSQEIIRSVLWASFISQHNLQERISNNGIVWGSKMLVLDPFSGKFPKKATAIVTSFEGSARVMQSGYEPIVPKQCLSKWVRKILSLLYLDLSPQKMEAIKREIEANGKVYKVANTSFIQGGIWPDKREECHSDARTYDGIDKPIEGPVKWNRDKLILSLLAKEPDKYAHYKFGLHPK